MKVVISTHFDIAHPVMFIKMGENKLNGLVDNFAGVFTSYTAGRNKNIPVYFTNYEELDYDGAIDVATKIDKETFVIVVDTVKETDLHGETASIANIYNFDINLIKQKLSGKVYYFDTPFEPKEDETFIYGQRFHFKTLYFGIPTPGDYHDINNYCSLEKIDAATKLLEELIEIIKTL